MRRKFLIALAALSLVCGAASGAEPAKNLPMTNVAVKTQIGTTPLFTVSNYGNNQQTTSTRQRWVMFIVTFTPKASVRGTFYLDDVRMEIQSITDTVSNGARQKVLFTGETKFWSIPMDGKVHQAFMAIPPQLVDRFYLPDSSVTASGFLTRVCLYSGDTLIGEGYSSNVTKKEQALFSVAAKPDVKNVIRVNGGVLPRNKTPWNNINYDYYDLIKE